VRHEVPEDVGRRWAREGRVGTYAKCAAACAVGALGWLSQGTATAAELVIITGQGAAPGVRELAAGFERVSGHTVTVLQPDAAELQRLINDGTADILTGSPEAMGERVKDGTVVVSTVTPFMLAGLGLSVRVGAPKPDITSVEAYTATLRAAPSIAYSRGCSGINVLAGIERLGLVQELAGKTVLTRGGPVTDYLASGEVEIGIQQSNIMVGVPGSDYVGPLPGFLNEPCRNDVGLLTTSKEPDAAREMIRFMISPEAAPLLRKTHAEPASP